MTVELVIRHRRDSREEAVPYDVVIGGSTLSWVEADHTFRPGKTVSRLYGVSGPGISKPGDMAGLLEAGNADVLAKAGEDIFPAFPWYLEAKAGREIYVWENFGG